ncbi:MAG TPA: hypothetical protein VHJ34_10050 [Actinomycetota bacterium]|nr:hypothetical protein [Actinomycetota bacterium]
MNIEATCNTCARRFLLSQTGPESDAPGRCPFCGARFGRHYSTVIVEAVDEAESSARRCAHTLGRLQGMETGFDVDVDGFLRELADQLRSQEQPRKEAS